VKEHATENLNKISNY